MSTCSSVSASLKGGMAPGNFPFKSPVPELGVRVVPGVAFLIVGRGSRSLFALLVPVAHLAVGGVELYSPARRVSLGDLCLKPGAS